MTICVIFLSHQLANRKEGRGGEGRGGEFFCCLICVLVCMRCCSCPNNQFRIALSYIRTQRVYGLWSYAKILHF